MIKILSNNELLSYLYDKIFYKRNIGNYQFKDDFKSVKNGVLPKISFNLMY